jgi:hypothetical protein
VATRRLRVVLTARRLEVIPNATRRLEIVPEITRSLQILPTGRLQVVNGRSRGVRGGRGREQGSESDRDCIRSLHISSLSSIALDVFRRPRGAG